MKAAELYNVYVDDFIVVIAECREWLKVFNIVYCIHITRVAIYQQSVKHYSVTEKSFPLVGRLLQETPHDISLLDIGHATQPTAAAAFFENKKYFPIKIRVKENSCNITLQPLVQLTFRTPWINNVKREKGIRNLFKGINP